MEGVILCGIWIKDRIAKVSEELELLSIPFDYEGVRRLMDAMNWSFDAGTVTQTALQLARMRASVDREKTPFPRDEDFVKALALMVQCEIYATVGMEARGSDGSVRTSAESVRTEEYGRI